MLLVLSLVVHGQLPLLLLNVVSDESAFVLRALNVLSHPLDLNVSLVERGFSILDVAVDGIAFLTQVSIGSLQILKIALEDVLVSGLLLNLLVIVLTQVPDTVFELSLAGCNFLDS